MPTDLIMPTVPAGPQQHPHAPLQRPAHNRSQSYQVPQNHFQHNIPPPHSQQVSPLSTSGSNSPTSPNGYPGRQRRPAYMPAVLRPNSDFVENKLSRARTAGYDGEDMGKASAGARRLSTSGFMPGLAVISQRLSRRNTQDEKHDFEGEWDLQLFPQVTDLPTRKHWKPDPESSICDDPACKRNFNYFIRRHHCRRCGNIFCDWHSSFAVPLDQDANFNPRAPAPSRTCGHCFDQYRSWHSRTGSQASSSASSDTQGGTCPPTPMNVGARVPIKGQPTMAKSPDVAASVPSDWNWSTF